jgi:hypothetical protein
MPSSLASRLTTARSQRFVGRAAEQALFQAALTAPELPFFVLHVYGPGGVGKTSLLREFVRICDQLHLAAAYLDARDIEPAPESFLAALQPALGLTPPASALEYLAGRKQRQVLLIDTCETISPLDRWLRQVFLPQLSDQVLTVLAGRETPAAPWRIDPGWQTLIYLLPLRNLSTDESRQYLARHHIPAGQHQAILNFTFGHPLALSLVTDTYAQRGSDSLQVNTSPDMLHTLMERLVEKVAGPAHRAALEACAIVRVLNEALLAGMLGQPDPATLPAGQGVHELFAWLRTLSFIDSTRDGLFPHDLIREILTAEVRWRNPDWYTTLHHRARSYYSRRLRQTSGQTQQQVLSDYIYLHRDNPVVRPFFEWQLGDSALPEPVQPADHPLLLEMVNRHEGEESTDLAAYWFKRQPEGALVFRDTGGEPVGLLQLVALPTTTPADHQIDPAIAAAWNYLAQHAPLRAGEKATYFRFWLARDSYQDVSLGQSLIFLALVRYYLTTPGLAFTFFPCADPDFWLPVFTYADLHRLPAADFSVGGQHFGLYGHDWRVTPPLAWLELLADRETATEVDTAAPLAAAIEELVVLSRPDFEAAVRQGLQNLSRPVAPGWAANPLLRSRLVMEQAGPAAAAPARIEALQTVLNDTVAALQSSPKELKFYRALYHTYLQPASTQEQAAELLDLPFSTYRRYLKEGIHRVIETLWQKELT